MSAVTARSLAGAVLVRVEEGAYANLALPAALRRGTPLDSRDRAFVTDLVYGTVREQRALDYRLAPLMSRPIESLDPPVRAALRLGTYQLVHDVPAHAAVGETVAIVPGRARGFVNAVLRKMAASPTPLPADHSVPSTAIRTSMPDWIADRLATDLGAAIAVGVMESAIESPVLTLRTDDPDTVTKELEDQGATVEPGRLIASALRVRGSGDPALIEAVRDGRATPQDEGSQAIVDIVGATPGMRVLDVCAAPGGKSLGFAARGAQVVAADVDLGRVRTMARNARRANVDVGVVTADARALPFHTAFDAVLVDAPCSGLGVLRRRPDARWKLQPADIVQLAALQQEIVDGALRAVRPGGRFVYSVCTVTAAETLDVDDWLADEHPEFTPEPPPGAPWIPHGRGALLLPQAVGTDGMFVLSLRAPG